MTCRCLLPHKRLSSITGKAQVPPNLLTPKTRLTKENQVCFPVSAANIIRIILGGNQASSAMCCKSVCKCIRADHVQFYLASSYYYERRRDSLLHSIRKETPFMPSVRLSLSRCEPKNVGSLYVLYIASFSTNWVNSTFCIMV